VHRTPAPRAPIPRLDAALEVVAGRSRLGCKGPGAEAWLRSAGLAPPQVFGPCGGDAILFIARLGSSEFFLDAPADSAPLAALGAALASAPAGVYPVLREDWKLVLAGVDAAAVLAQACNVDFAALAPQSRAVVMTLMIGVAVLVARGEAGGAPAYMIWCDPSYGPYLSETLGSIVVEHGGTFKGAAA